MASKKKTDKTIRDKISSTWGLVLTAFTIFGVGFGAGCHFWKMNHYDEITKLNNQILDNREKAEKEILGLHNQIYALQEELIVEKSLHHEKK